MADTTKIPAQLVAGDGWAWTDAAAFADYPPPDWSLSYVLRPVNGGAATTITATVGDNAYELAMTASATAAIAAGDYTWTALATNPGADDRAQVGAGRLCVLPDPTTATTDQRTAAERILAAIDATLEGRATKDAESYSIEGRSIARTPVADLLRLKTHYQAQVAAEQDPGGSPITYRRVAL